MKGKGGRSRMAPPSFVAHHSPICGHKKRRLQKASASERKTGLKPATPSLEGLIYNI